MKEANCKSISGLISPICNTTEKEANDYLGFIRFCVERLNKGGSVQAIWNEYQNL